MRKDKGPVEVVDKDAKGLLGKPGTFNHTLNVGCLCLIALAMVMFAAVCS